MASREAAMPLRKRGEDLEGLWGELASSFTKLGARRREASLVMHSLQHR
jgi:hypothetical protein